MIEKKLVINREHTRDYDIVTREVAVKTYKFFGITLFKNSGEVNNTNKNTMATARKQIGFKPIHDEEFN